MATLSVRLRNEANTSTTATLTSAFDVSFQVERNKPGSGEFSLATRDPVAATVDDGAVVQFLVNGVPRLAARIKSHDATLISVNDEGQEVTTYECVGLLGDWDGAVVQLSTLQCDVVPTMDERIWNWASGEYSTNVLSSPWADAVEIATQGWASPFYTGQPAGWSDGDAKYLWAANGAISGYDLDENALPGNCYFYETFLVDAGKKVLDWSADNYGQLYVNGKKMQEGGDFRKKQTYEFETTAGFLTLGFLVLNAEDDGPPGGNPGGLIWSMRLNSPEGPIHRSSSDSMRVLGYPSSEPTMSIGQILRLTQESNLIDTTWTVGGTDTTDSTGASYAPEAAVGELTFKIYTDTLLDVIEAMTEVWIDVVVAVDGKTLSPYKKGTLGSVSPLQLITGTSDAGVAAPGAVNVVDLSWEVTEAQFTKLAARDADGWFVVGSGDSWGTFRMEQINSRATAAAIANRVLSLYGQERRTASFEYIPLNEATDLPFIAFGVFDTINVPIDDEGTTSPQLVQAITVTSDEDGIASFAVEVGDPVTEEIQAIERALKRGAPGTISGLAASASPTSGKTAHHTLARMSVSTPTASSPAHCIASAPSPSPGTSTAPCLFIGLVTSLRLIGEGSTGTSTVTVSDGTTTWTLTGSANGLVDFEGIGDRSWTTRTQLTVEIVAVGHTALHVYADVAEVS
jgi:hypothetical protein